MAILAECPICHKKQSVKNRLCDCGEDLVKAKRSNRVKYWINYRLPSGKQRREAIGNSVEEARAADGKRKSQKRENRLFDIKPETKMTFSDLAKWYLGLEKVKSLSSFWRVEISLAKFNSVFGGTIVSKIKPSDLENYQAKRKAEGMADNTVDLEIGAAKSMVYKAFDNDIVSGETLRAFKKIKKMLRKNGNARDRILGPEEYKNLKNHCSEHLKEVILVGYHTGMREGEILNLTWDKVSLDSRLISLEAADTKDNEPRDIPMSDEVYEILADKKSRIRSAEEDGHVFLFKNKPIKNVRKALRNACEKAKIPYGRFVKDGFIFHDLRHTFNTNMRKSGVPESVIMKITGHSTREMFDRYNTIDREDTRNAVDQLESFLANVDQNVDQANFFNPKTKKGAYNSLK